MDYILTIAAFILGVGYHVMQKIRKLRVSFPEFDSKTIKNTFLKEEWDSLMTSAIVMFTFELAHYIIHVNQIKIPEWVDNWGIYVLALVLGYAGQRVAYAYLGTAEKVLLKKAQDLENKG